MHPGPGLIGSLTGQPDLAATLGFALGQSLTEQRGGNDRQAAIRNHADDVVSPFASHQAYSRGTAAKPLSARSSIVPCGQAARRRLSRRRKISTTKRDS